MKQISKLESSKSLIDDLNRVKDRIEVINKKIRSSSEKVRAKAKEIKELMTKRQEHFDVIDKIAQKKKLAEGQKKKCEDNKKKLRNLISKYFEEIKQTANDQRNGNRKFARVETKLKRLQQDLERQTEFEKRKAEREKQQKEWEERKEERKKRQEERQKRQEEYNRQWLEYEAERKKNPYEQEIHLCGNLITYLEQLRKSMKSAQLKQKTASILGQAKKNSKNSIAISHPIDKFSAFQRLAVKPPVTHAQVEEALKIISEKKAYYKTFKVDEIQPSEEYAAPITTVESDATALMMELEDDDDEDNYLPESSADLTVSL